MKREVKKIKIIYTNILPFYVYNIINLIPFQMVYNISNWFRDIKKKNLYPPIYIICAMYNGVVVDCNNVINVIICKLNDVLKVDKLTRTVLKAKVYFSLL